MAKKVYNTFEEKDKSLDIDEKKKTGCRFGCILPYFLALSTQILVALNISNYITRNWCKVWVWMLVVTSSISITNLFLGHIMFTLRHGHAEPYSRWSTMSTDYVVSWPIKERMVLWTVSTHDTDSGMTQSLLNHVFVGFDISVCNVIYCVRAIPD